MSSAAWSQAATPTAPNDSGINVRDRDAGAITAGQQSNRKSDIKLTRQIRRAVEKDDALSTVAHNVKIVTVNGMVTLRGPVGAGISSAEVDDLTRQLAAQLRELPHESVGFVADQAPVRALTATTPIATQGAVAMSLRKAILPRVIDLLQAGSSGRMGSRFIVKGPNDIELDGTVPLAREFVDAWLNAVADAKR